MYCRLCVAVVGIAALSTSIALAQASKDSSATKPGHGNAPGQTAGKAAPQTPPGQPQLPAGWTEADMQACMIAATPGPMHAYLVESVGVWAGKTTMWMGPGTEPMKSECTSTITAMMDGRFTRCEVSGDMPGMGPFNGFGVYGFDNVGQKFQSTWFDNCGTGMMVGTGELSSDHTTMTWTFTYNCPVAKKTTVMREVERRTGKDSMTLEMFGSDPKTGKEYKMMQIDFTRKAVPGATAAAGTR
jgi:hypothetical protein